MNSHFLLGPKLPNLLAKRLFGDRKTYGRIPPQGSASWAQWERHIFEFYSSTQLTDSGDRVSHAGYKILRSVDLKGKRVLEIGPGQIRHHMYWNGSPGDVTLIDSRKEFLGKAEETLSHLNVPFESKVLDLRSNHLPFPDGAFDVVLSFYSFEHIYPFDLLADEIFRVLRPKGVVAGSIPCEGGLAWGMGRFLTTRRWIHRNTPLDYDQIICWEHPNFASEILRTLDTKFGRRRLSYWPIHIPVLDLNLLTSFVYEKRP